VGTPGSVRSSLEVGDEARGDAAEVLAAAEHVGVIDVAERRAPAGFMP
jgi:hypothetical protein